MAKQRVTPESNATGAGASPARIIRKRTRGEIAAEPAPTANQVAQLAYSYWEARGRQGGSPEEDWARAEKELRRV